MSTARKAALAAAALAVIAAGVMFARGSDGARRLAAGHREPPPGSTPAPAASGQPGPAAPLSPASKPPERAAPGRSEPSDTRPQVAAIEALPPDTTPEAIFDSGRRLIDRNSGESLGISREELEEGVRRVERARAAGYRNEKGVQEALAWAFGALKSRVNGTREESLAFERKESEAYRALARLEPGEPEWRMRFVSTLTDRDAQIDELEVLAREHPRYAPGRQALGELLCEAGRADEGVRNLASAAEALDPEDVDRVTPDLVAAAYRCRGEEAAESVRRVASQRRPR